MIFSKPQNIYVIDAEFIDTPSDSELISFGIVHEEGSRYFEFDYDARLITPWLQENVVPHLSGDKTTLQDAGEEIRRFVPNSPEVEFWALCGAYDFYWLMRLMGGLMDRPDKWPPMFRELGLYTANVPALPGYPPHHAENDAAATLARILEIIETARGPG